MKTRCPAATLVRARPPGLTTEPDVASILPESMTLSSSASTMIGQRTFSVEEPRWRFGLAFGFRGALADERNSSSGLMVASNNTTPMGAAIDSTEELQSFRLHA